MSRKRASSSRDPAAEIRGVNLKEIALLYRSNAQSRVLETRAGFQQACPIACMAGCAFSSVRRSSTRWATSADAGTPTTDNALAAHPSISRRRRHRRAAASSSCKERQMNNTTLWDLRRGGRQGSAFVRADEACAARRANCAPRNHRHVLQHSGLIAHYQNETGVKKREGGRERLENLNELVNAATMFGHENETTAYAFLTHASLEAGEHQRAIRTTRCI